MKVQSINELRKFVNSSKGRREISAFIKEQVRPLEDDSFYHCLVKEAQGYSFAGKDMEALQKRLQPFIVELRPGHDHGHISRDLATGLLLYAEDPFIARGYQSERLAGLLAAAYHDIAVAVTPRYLDKRCEVGHAEIGAWIFVEVNRSHMPESLCRLVAYSIAAHTHITTQLVGHDEVTGRDFVRDPYNDVIFYEDDSRKPIRFAPIMARAADRIDTTGITHFGRHVVAALDSAEIEGATDFSAGEFFSLTDQVKVLLRPTVEKVEGLPTVYGHMKAFADSAHNTALPYGRYDHMMPVVQELINRRVAEVSEFNSIATSTDLLETDICWEALWGYLEKVASQDISDVKEPLLSLWVSLTQNECRALTAAIRYADHEHNLWCDQLFARLTLSRDPFVAELVVLLYVREIFGPRGLDIFA